MGKIAICKKLNDMGILNPTGYKKLELKQNYNNSGIKNNSYLWTPSTIRNILNNEIYIGNTVQGKRRVKSYKIHKLENVPQEEWIKVENTHLKIIEKEIFEKARKISQNDTRVQNSGILSIWAGLLRCGDCGFAMHKKTCKNKIGKIYEYYICGTYKKKSKVKCTRHNLKVEELEQAILQTIQEQIKSLVNVSEIIREFEEKDNNNLQNESIRSFKSEKRQEIEKLGNLKRFLYEDWKNGDLTRNEYLEYKQKYDENIEKLEIAIRNIDEQSNKEKEINFNNYKFIKEFEENKNIFKLDREILLELIEYIEVFENNKIRIHFKFTK